MRWVFVFMLLSPRDKRLQHPLQIVIIVFLIYVVIAEMNRIVLLNKTLAMFLGFLMVTSASAHGVQGGGLINGLMHPVFGPDHLLAMVAVGILSVQIGGKAIWSVPLAFVVCMLVGGVLGMKGVAFPSVETGIAASVFVLGAAIALPKKVPTLLIMALVGVFGVFHGYAHGAEMPSVAEPVLYATGFVLSTAGLHIAGVLIGVVAKRIARGDIALRVVGLFIAAVGLYILFGL